MASTVVRVLKMIIKTLVLLFLGAIILSLALAGFFLVGDEGKPGRTVTALKIRIGLSVALFALLIIAGYVGLLQPAG